MRARVTGGVDGVVSTTSHGRQIDDRMQDDCGERWGHLRTQSAISNDARSWDGGSRMSRWGGRRSSALLAATAVGLMGQVAGFSPGHSPGVPATLPSVVSKPLIAVFGDSLITQAQSELTAELTNAFVVQNSFPGLAACFYLDAHRLQTFLRTYQPKVAILEFWGNAGSSTPCLTSPRESPGYYEQYRADLMRMTKQLVRRGAHVFIIGTIPDAVQVVHRDPRWDHLNDIYAKIPFSYEKKKVTFVNVQSVVENGGRFTWYLPCTSEEISCDAPVSDVIASPPIGDNIVRSGDGLHFCPLFPDTYSMWVNFADCSAYASGSYRYAKFIGDVVESFLATGTAPRYVGAPLPPPDTPEKGVRGQVDPYTGDVWPQR